MTRIGTKSTCESTANCHKAGFGPSAILETIPGSTTIGLVAAGQGIATIAELLKVENDVIKGMLKEIGVNYAQGYGIDKPQPFDELLERSTNVTDINMLEDN